MPEVIINGPDGRLECRYMPSEVPGAPTALILHPEPDNGGTMNNRVTYSLYKHFQARGFAVLRLIFGVLGAPKAITVAAKANCQTQQLPLIGYSHNVPAHAHAGLLDFPLGH